VAARLVAAGVFVVFGAGKFIDHASEVESFAGYGLPAPDAFVYAIGVIELIGGLLVAGLVTRLAVLVLAGDMVGEIVVSESTSASRSASRWRTVMLVVCLYLLWTGPGHHALDRSRSRISAAARRLAESRATSRRTR
jgi:uncharacterized membrane protein YphA (DoxX/SURF4 family)